MTVQIKEKIIINGEQHLMYSEPLEPYLIGLKEKVKFDFETTACWRGYVGTWKLVNDKLFLIDFLGNKYDADSNVFKEVGLDYLFPDKEEVHAHWFTGLVEIPDGEILVYGHTDYSTQYENNLFLHFNKGILVDFKSENTLEKMVDEVQIKHSQSNMDLWQKIRRWLINWI